MSKEVPYQLDVDPEISRIFSDPPPGGFLPSDLKWSSDSSALTFLRRVPSEDGQYTKELWLHDPSTGRERPIRRSADFSISEYDWCGPKKLVAISQGDLFTMDLDGNTSNLTKTEIIESSIKCSPDGTSVAFLRDHNIVAIDLGTHTERQITSSGTLTKTMGEVTWVYGEEFRVKTGFGWSPDSSRIWFYSTDLSNVTKSVIVKSAEGETREQFYPSSGEPNPRVRIGVADFSKKDNQTIWLETGDDDDIYLPKIVWNSTSGELLVVRLDRLQTIMDLLKCDASIGTCDTIVTERDPHWISIPHEPKITRKGKEFLWLSERDGFFHIYRFDMEGRPLEQLTSGKWVVTSIDGVDEKQGVVYFRANAQRPTDYGLYKVNVRNKKISSLSQLPGAHSANFAPDFKYYVDTHSALNRSPKKELYKSSGELASTIAAHDLREYNLPPVTTDFIPIKTPDGETLNARLTRPRAFEPDKKYPVLIYVYGGPGAQIVKNEFRSKYNPWMFLLASRGILVFSVDGRGSFGRGHEFETAVHRRLGETELKDQLAGVEYLKSLPYVDPKRIAIYGWSYGGTMVLNALTRTENVFSVGVSVAPVTDWRQYDSAYTERFMQRPSDNPEGYDDTSLLSVAGNLDAPLLLMHGLSDDNVHFVNSARFIEELVKAGKQFNLMVYPGRDHGMRGGEPILEHVFSTLTNFIMRNL